MREMAIRYREHTLFLSVDDKAKIPVGEPNFPLSAVARGKRVLVAPNQLCAVGDHDFSRMSFTPSAVLVVDVPESMSESFLRGKPYYSLKFQATTPSTALRHSAEMTTIAKQNQNPPIQMLYHDGGPDHNHTFLSVRIALIAYFLMLDLDLLVAVRTPAGWSFLNPVERVHAIANLGLQSVGVMRQELASPHLERAVKKCNSVAELRAAMDSNEALKEELLDAIQPNLVLLTDALKSQKLKENSFQIYTPAADEEVSAALDCLKEREPSIGQYDKVAQLKDRPWLKQFLEHCCKCRTYVFCIKKCGKEECQTCKVPRLPRDVFDDIDFLPDPKPNERGDHYLPFRDLYGSDVGNDESEKHLPSKALTKAVGHGIEGFQPTIQTAKSVSRTLKCAECAKPRMMYAARKVSDQDKLKLTRTVDSIIYVCVE